VDSHELPDDSEHELLVSVDYVCVANADQFDFHLIACIQSDLRVDTHLKHVVGVLLDTIPLNYVWIDLVDNFEQYLAISALLVQVVDEQAFNVEGVDPQSERTLLFGTLNSVIVDDSGSFVFFFGELLKAVSGVEDFGDVDRVRFSVAFYKVLGIHDMGNAQSVRVLNQRFCAHQFIGLAEVT